MKSRKVKMVMRMPPRIKSKMSLEMRKRKLKKKCVSFHPPSAKRNASRV